MNADMIPMMICLIALLPCTGFLMAATPWLMKGRECFAVTVPETAQADPRLRAFKRRYSLIVAVFTLAVTALGVAFAFAEYMAGIVVVLSVGILLLCLGGFALMLYFRRKVMRIKNAEGWQAVAQEHVADTGVYTMPKVPGLAWNLLYIPVLLVTLVAVVLAYPHMPDMIPMHSDFSGNVNSWSPKSPATAAFPLWIQLFLAAAMVFCHWTILRSKKGANPESPAASLWAYAMFARAQVIFLLATGLAFSLSMLLFVATSVGMLSLAQAAVYIMFVSVFVLIGAVAISLIYGQSGARILKRVNPAAELRYDDDEHWKLGVFYFNKEDASLFLPERFGIGWTMNFARPAVWAIIIGFVAVTIAFVIGVSLLA